MNLEAFLPPADAARFAWDRVHHDLTDRFGRSDRRPGPRSSLQILADVARRRRDQAGRAA